MTKTEIINYSTSGTKNLEILCPDLTDSQLDEIEKLTTSETNEFEYMQNYCIYKKDIDLNIKDEELKELFTFLLNVDFVFVWIYRD